jgi:hypothetical protein
MNEIGRAYLSSLEQWPSYSGSADNSGSVARLAWRESDPDTNITSSRDAVVFNDWRASCFGKLGECNPVYIALYFLSGREWVRLTEVKQKLSNSTETY